LADIVSAQPRESLRAIALRGFADNLIILNVVRSRIYRAPEEKMASTLERAFELAKSGEFQTVAEIRRQLLQERYDKVLLHLRGPTISRQLKAMITAALAETEGIS
jgi:hypothetical protein